MLQADLLIDDFMKDFKGNKLEIAQNTNTNRPRLEKTSDLNNENSPVNIDNTNKNNNNFVELKCLVKQKNIKELIVLNKNIIKIGSNFYQYLSNIEHLNLSNNSIEKISKKILNMANLKSLILNSNRIPVLPSFLKELKHLEEIQLENNTIQLIPSSIQYFPSLKILNLSQNILEKLPIELGLIKNLYSLNIDRNEFSEIPTSLCFLTYLNCIKLEWFDFLEPPQNIEQYDQNIIASLKMTLNEKLLASKSYIDFQTFVIKLSQNIQDKINDESFNTYKTEKAENYSIYNKDIFSALDSNYFGIIKSFINENIDLINKKDSNGKTPLYLAIQQNKKKIYDFFLSKVDVKNISSNYLLLFKAIRLRNYPLVVKLHKLGISLNDIDSKGNNVFHILFSVFNKNYEQCTKIGNYFLENNFSNYNSLNKDGWSPLHIAAKYSSHICFEWIGYINRIFKEQHKELFNINLQGKNMWTPFHLACSSYKYKECVILLRLGASLLIRTADGKLPKNVTNNYFLSKMLFIKEQEYYFQKYEKPKKNENKAVNHNYSSANLFTLDNYYDDKLNNKITLINSERSKSEILCSNNQYSLYEKYHTVMLLSLCNNKGEIITKVRGIFHDLNYNNINNYIIICDVLNIIQNYNIIELLNDIKNQKNKLNGSDKADNKKKSNYLLRQFESVINFLEKTRQKKIIFKTNLINNFRGNYKENLTVFINKKKKDVISQYKNNIIKREASNEVNVKTNSPGFQKIKEKKVQESINSIDFED